MAPARQSLRNAAIEFEAEAVAYVVTNRLGLQGQSAAYLSRYLPGTGPPEGSSLDLIAKVAGQVERMARETLRPDHVPLWSRPRASPKGEHAEHVRD